MSDWWGSDSYEIANGWDPLNPDENTNGIPDSWEMAFPETNMYDHADNDGISNFDELMQNSDPSDPDSHTAQPYVIRCKSSMPGWVNDGMTDIGLEGWVKIYFEGLKTNLDLCVWVKEGRTQEQFRVEWSGATQKGIRWLNDQEVLTSASATTNTRPYLLVQDLGQRPDFTNTPGGEYKIVVLSVDLVNVWETDDVCNRVSNPKQNTDNRLFVATEGSGQAEVTVKSSIQPAGVEDKVLCAIYDGSTHLVSDAFSTACEAELNFTPTGPTNNYLVRVGIDANENGMLESSEFCATATNFDVTAFTSVHYDEEEDYLHDKAASWVTGWAYPVGASLLLRFLSDPSLPLSFDSTTTVGINCFTQSNLTHNAGETFAPSGAGTLEEVRWNAGSDAGEKIAISDELEAIINAVLTAHRTEVTAYFVANPAATSYSANWTSSNVPVNFAQTGYLPLAGYDLRIAFGHATLPSVTVDVVIKKGLFGGLHIDSLIVTGSLADLYDFNYEDGGLAARAAVLQIGWDSDIAGRDAGNIFFDRVNFQETFDDWDFEY